MRKERKSNKKIFLHTSMGPCIEWERSDCCSYFAKINHHSENWSIPILKALRCLSDLNPISVKFARLFLNFSNPHTCQTLRTCVVHAILILIFATSCFVVVLLLLLFSYDHDYFRKRTICNWELGILLGRVYLNINGI